MLNSYIVVEDYLVFTLSMLWQLSLLSLTQYFKSTVPTPSYIYLSQPFDLLHHQETTYLTLGEKELRKAKKNMF